MSEGGGYDQDGDADAEAVQQGADRQNRERSASSDLQDQGRKTREANRDQVQSGSPNQGTQ